MERTDIAAIRKDYSSRELDESSVNVDPFLQFAAWLEEAISAGGLEPTAMNVATINEDGSPSSRIVLLKGYDARGFVFFTNYESRKGRALTRDGRCVLHFFWPELERQVNIEGKAAKTPQEESETYFKSRPLGSRIGAWASEQSSVLGDRRELEGRVAELEEKYSHGDVPLPPFWGGFRIVPTRFEFWQGRPSRLHDRICYEPSVDGWAIKRLSP